MLEILEPALDAVWLTVAPTAGPRAWKQDDVTAWMAGRVNWQWEPDFGRALARAQVGAGTVLVTGSFHTVGDAIGSTGLTSG